jgi:hypothetical protein
MKYTRVFFALVGVMCLAVAWAAVCDALGIVGMPKLLGSAGLGCTMILIARFDED